MLALIKWVFVLHLAWGVCAPRSTCIHTSRLRHETEQAENEPRVCKVTCAQNLPSQYRHATWSGLFQTKPWFQCDQQKQKQCSPLRPQMGQRKLSAQSTIAYPCILTTLLAKTQNYVVWPNADPIAGPCQTNAWTIIHVHNTLKICCVVCYRKSSDFSISALSWFSNNHQLIRDASYHQ